jgi:BirA family transcriptional regulator, biotin operon repressor / biotin---[acetyl-CoA-carboxylase] ligase
MPSIPNGASMMSVTEQLLSQFITRLLQTPQPDLRTLAVELKVEIKQILEIIEWLQGVDVNVAIDGGQVFFATPLYLIDKKMLEQRLPCRIFYFQTVDSTNQFLLNHQLQLQAGDLCIAEHQTQGRGRQGKTWVAAYGCSVCFSLIHRLSNGFGDMSGLSLVIGIAIADCLNRLGIKDVALKWPNDVYRQSKKLAGILIESNYDPSHGGTALTIGVGLNLIHSQPLSLSPFADLADKVHLPDFKSRLVIALWHAIQAALILYEAQGFASFQQRWLLFDLYYQKQVYIYDGLKTYVGRHDGIDHKGYLILAQSDGQRVRFNHAVSLRLVSENNLMNEMVSPFTENEVSMSPRR